MTLKYFVLLPLLLILIPGSIHGLREGPLVTLVGFQRPKGCGGTILTDRHFLTTVTCTFIIMNNKKRVEHPSLVKGAYFIENKPWNKRTVSKTSVLKIYTAIDNHNLNLKL